MSVNANLEKLRKVLVGAARKQPANDAVPYAFDQRIMAHVRPASAPNAWIIWGQALWRAAVACIAIAALCSIWSFWPASDVETATLESTVFAGAHELEVW